MSGPPPWHMWGSSQGLSYDQSLIVNGVLVVPTSSQLVSVDYGRPDNWRYLVSAQLISIVGAPVVPLQVGFDVMIGIGRAMITLPELIVLNFAVAEQFAGNSKSTVRAGLNAVGLNNGLVANAPGVTDNYLETIPAQALKIVARAHTFGGGANAVTINLLVTAMVTPSAHVRPEWFKIGAGHEEFPGGEDHGT